MNNNNITGRYILEERYRPDTLDKLVIPQRYVSVIDGIIKTGITPHLLLYGIQGCGKTSLGYLIAKLTDANLLYINASLDRTTDVMRNKVMRFCTKNSVGTSKYKIILLDEIDNPYAKDFRKSLLSPIERYGENTRFILTVNQKNVLDKALVSRLCEIDFIFDNNETKTAKKRFIGCVVQILEAEQIKYDLKAIAMLVEKKFPDMRKVINIINLVSKSGAVEMDSVNMVLNYDIDAFFGVLKSKDFSALKKYVQSMTIGIDDFYGLVYASIERHVAPEDIPKTLVKVYEYMRDSNLVVDPFISVCTFGLDMMESVKLR